MAELPASSCFDTADASVNARFLTMRIVMGRPFIANFVDGLIVASEDVKDHVGLTNLTETRSASAEGLRPIRKSCASAPKLEVITAVSIDSWQDMHRMRFVPFSGAAMAVLVISNGHCLTAIHRLVCESTIAIAVACCSLGSG